MAPEHRPVATAFFPAARIGIFVGVVVAIVGAWAYEGARAAAGAVREARAPSALPQDSALVGPIVAHVWLESCADCMTAFEAHARIQDARALDGIPQANVAYGASTPEFRARYRVEAGLIEDTDGSKVVHRFGIASFTTLVIDKSGALVLRDRPDHAGYVERVREAWARAR